MEYNYNKKSIWKWVILYIIIGAVAYGLIYYFLYYKKGGYSYNPQNYQTQTASTAGWKTYTNTQYGFEFKYPNGWTAESLNPQDISLYKYINNNSNERQYEGRIYIVVFVPNPAVTAGEAMGERPQVISSSEVEIDGKIFTRKLTTFGLGDNLIYRGVVNSNSDFTPSKDNFGIQAEVYSFVGGSNGTGNDFDNLFDQVMKTFKFTK